MQNQIKIQMIRRFSQALTVTVIVFMFTLPMLLMSSDLDFFFEGSKISLGELLLYGTPLALIGGFFCMTVSFFVDLALVRNGVYTLKPEQAKLKRRLRRLKVVCAVLVVLATLAKTGIVYFIANKFSVEKTSTPTVFADYEEAKAYLSQGLADDGSHSEVGFADPNGNLFFRSIYNPEKYGYINIDENQRVMVFSRKDTDRADRASKMITNIYFTLIVIEVAAGFIIYFIRRGRVIRSVDGKLHA